MWITGLCAFPPLIPATEISIREAGLVLITKFTAPVDKSYLLSLRFVFSSTETRIKDNLVGERYSGNYCTGNIQYDAIPQQERSGLGLPISFKVVMRTEPGSDLVFEQTFNSLCYVAHATNDKYRDVGRFGLNEGVYRIEVYNLQPQPAFGDIKVEMSFDSGDRK